VTDTIYVLDKGYVRLVKSMGDDLDVINSAKVSFDREADSFGEREARLLAFLTREEHSSVFRHSALTYEVHAPLFVARQWFKYMVASTHLEDQNGWNESSRRYVTETPQFYIPMPGEWRSAPDNMKQGSGENLDRVDGILFTKELESYISEGEALYNWAMASGVAAEQARLFLPAYGMYVRWRWTASLGAVMHFLQQRLDHAAQKEIQDFAVAVRDITATKFPVCMETISGNI